MYRWKCCSKSFVLQGWVAYRWKCFLLSKNPAKWQDKRQTCQQFGGILARIEDRCVETTFNIVKYCC
jgi:hypothetical protein